MWNTGHDPGVKIALTVPVRQALGPLTGAVQRRQGCGCVRIDLTGRRRRVASAGGRSNWVSDCMPPPLSLWAVIMGELRLAGVADP